MDHNGFPSANEDTWIDHSGYGYHHKIYTSNFQNTVRDGVQALCADGGGDYMEISNLDQSFTFGSEYTLIAWAWARKSGTRTLWRSNPNHHALVLYEGSDFVSAYENFGRGRITFGSGADRVDAAEAGLYEKWVMWTVVGTKDGKQTFYYNDAQGGATMDFTITGQRHHRMFHPGQTFGCGAAFYAWDWAFTNQEVSKFYMDTKDRYAKPTD